VLTVGVLPVVPGGQAVWQLVDGTRIALTQDAAGPGAVRYLTDGLRITLSGAVQLGPDGAPVVDPAGSLLCELCGPLIADGVVEVWLFSAPRLVAAHRTDADPCQTFRIPLGDPLDGHGPIPVGQHTLQLALPTASGMQAVNVGVTVRSPVPSLVNTGGGPMPLVPMSLVLLLAVLAGTLALVDRGREVASVVAVAQRARARARAAQPFRMPGFDALDLRLAELRDAIRRSR
jgi:hypothetical protein